MPIKSKRCGPKVDKEEMRKRKREEEDDWDTEVPPGAKKPIKVSSISDYRISIL